jgi:hypothetical protein
MWICSYMYRYWEWQLWYHKPLEICFSKWNALELSTRHLSASTPISNPDMSACMHVGETESERSEHGILMWTWSLEISLIFSVFMRMHCENQFILHSSGLWHLAAWFQRFGKTHCLCLQVTQCHNIEGHKMNLPHCENFNPTYRKTKLDFQ